MNGKARVGISWRLVVFEAFVLALGMTLLAVLPANAAPSATDEAALIAQWDQGVSTIDVTNYPVVLRESYTVFVDRCARCHKISRTVNADYVLPDQWKECVESMARKLFSGINKAKSNQIQDFLIYDSSVRKKNQQDAALAKLSAVAKKAAEDKIAEIRLKYEKGAPLP